MPLPEQLSSCLFNLTTHCEGLLAQNENLRQENETLRSRLDALRPPARGQDTGKSLMGIHPSSANFSSQMAAEPPGSVPEAWSTVVPQQQTPSSPQGPPWIPLSTLPENPKPKLKSRLGVAIAAAKAARVAATGAHSSTGGTDTTSDPLDDVEEELMTDSQELKEPSLCGEAATSAGRQPPKSEGGMGDACLAAARLGMLSLKERKEHEGGTQNTFSETFAVFSENVRGDIRELKAHLWQGYFLEAFVNSFVFRAFCVLAIAANTMYIGWHADHQVKNSYGRLHGRPKEEDWILPDVSFTVWFSVELALRILAEKRAFFTGEDSRWNFFDCFLVFNAVLELMFPQISSNISFLRILRVFRIVRIVRVVRTVKALKSLRTMVFALLNSFVCLMWAFVMIILIMFIFGVIFNSAVSGYFDGLDANNPQHRQDAESVNLNFGSIYETMVTLLCSITGGNDWMMYGEKLRLLDGGEIYFAIFYFYICFCMVGMLNVVTGIFVDSAVCTRTEDEVVECFTEDQRRTSEEVKRIFKEADVDKSGTLSYEELANHLENPWVKAYFSGLDIDPSEAGIIFTLIDTDGSNSVAIDEFVDGTMKLKGHAKSIDVLSMMFDTVRFSIKFNQLCAFIEDELLEIKQALFPEKRVTTPKKAFSALEAPAPLASENKFSRLRPRGAREGLRDRVAVASHP